MPAEGFPDSRIDHMLAEMTPLFVKQFDVTKPQDVEWLLYSFAPGRINLIGEHVDYMGGFVCPAAVPDGSHVLAGRLRTTETPPPGLRFYATYTKEHFDVHTIPFPDVHGLKTWQKYIVGAVTLRLAYLGLSLDAPELRGVCFVIHSTVPVGAGLSGSAAFGVSLLSAINSVLTEDYRRAGKALKRTHHLVPSISLKERLALARQAQQIETDFCGAEVGMMGHFNAALAEANKFMVVDCSKWTYQTCSMDAISGNGYGWLLVDSMIRHDLMGDTQTVFHEVRKDQETAQKRIAANLFKGEPFTFTQLVRAPLKYTKDGDVVNFVKKCKCFLTPSQYERSMYQVEEQLRVLRFRKLVLDSPHLTKKDRIDQIGTLLNEAHVGMRDLLKITVPEVDYIHFLANEHPEVAGGRLTGSGFGGCLLLLVKLDAQKKVTDFIQHQFKERFHVVNSVYPINSFCSGMFVASLTHRNVEGKL